MTNKICVMVAMACAVAAAIGCSSPAHSHAAAAAAAAQSAGQLTSNWSEDDSTSKMDGSKTTVLSVPAQNTISYWLGSSRPILFFRCKEKKLDGYIVTGTASAVDGDADHLESHRVRLRYDSGEPVAEWWNESTDDKGLFSNAPERLLRKTEGSRRLRFEFTPFNADPVVVSFDVRGLKSLAPHLAPCL